MKNQGGYTLLYFLCFALFISISACAVLLYVTVDKSITISYCEAGIQSFENINDLTFLLLEKDWLGLTQGEVLVRLNAALARRPEKNILVKIESAENFIWFDAVRFEFQDGLLIKIR